MATDGGQFGSPRKISDLAEFAADYIAELRGSPAGASRGRFLTYAFDYFSDNAPSMRALEALGLMFVDRLYRLSSELPFTDAHVLVPTGAKASASSAATTSRIGRTPAACRTRWSAVPCCSTHSPM
jgi:hypothetical protein